jgi:hypothetical protein
MLAHTSAPEGVAEEPSALKLLHDAVEDGEVPRCGTFKTSCRLGEELSGDKRLPKRAQPKVGESGARVPSLSRTPTRQAVRELASPPPDCSVKFLVRGRGAVLRSG